MDIQLHCEKRDDVGQSFCCNTDFSALTMIETIKLINLANYFQYVLLQLKLKQQQCRSLDVQCYKLCKISRTLDKGVIKIDLIL